MLFLFQGKLCIKTPCQNGGVCSESGGVRTCDCIGSFTGDNCEHSKCIECINTVRWSLCVFLNCQEAYQNDVVLKRKPIIKYIVDGIMCISRKICNIT